MSHFKLQSNQFTAEEFQADAKNMSAIVSFFVRINAWFRDLPNSMKY